MSSLKAILEKKPIVTSAPCRIDMGGTIDLATFYQPLRHWSPCTFNIAVNHRTTVTLLPFRGEKVKISSRGFESAEFDADRVPFDHPLGLMFAVAAYFDAAGVHIRIDSSSPPRSALGGSSAAAVALTTAFLRSRNPVELTAALRKRVAMLAHAIEESVAGVPCGRQDQLAAAYGGVNAWHWESAPTGFSFKRTPVVRKNRLKSLERNLLLAYCGIPHTSSDVNGRWVRQFLSGRYRNHWREIVSCTKKFIDALARNNYKGAIAAMNRETAVRSEMTPEVLDRLGKKLVDAALRSRCGARFTGAGGGGCLWALGSAEDIDRIRRIWEEILQQRGEARLLEPRIDSTGLHLHS
jgi:D-glycero-alpha-D-manno-heptose-7-phosphate kinase